MTDSTACSETSQVRSWRQGAAAYIQLNRPEKANAYHQGMLEALEDSVEQMAALSEVRAIVICGAGNRAFCAGADRAELAGRDWRSALGLKSSQVFSRISRCPAVTLAAINGAAVGGGLELALACDLRIAAAGARFSLPEPELGLIPAAGGIHRLKRLLGTARAKELILGGQVWEAEDALRLGLISEIAHPEELLARAQFWAERIAGRDATALELAKRALDFPDVTEAAADFDRLAQALLYQLRL